MSHVDSVQFHLIPVRKWYEKQEMIEDARAYGFAVTESLFDDWVEKGLLGPAHREGLGRGRGSIARRPSQQYTMLLELLRARQQAKLRIGQLCAFPVWRWVYWGELGGVSLRQVRRAMDTWIASVRKTATETERKEVRRAVEKLQGASFSGKRALLDELTRIGTFEKEPDAELLRYLMESVVTDSPIHLNTTNGEKRSGDIELITTLHPLRLEAFRHYEERIASLSDAVWEWARVMLLFGQRLGQKEQPVLARNRRLAARYRRVTAYSMIWDSCYDLLTPLSIAAQKIFPEETSDTIPFLNPQAWQEKRAFSIIQTTLAHSTVLLPDGSHVAYLRNSVCISYQGKEHSFTLDLPFL